MNRDNWDDIRFVIAVAETGTVSAAARRLGVTHGTVLRRIATFEDRLGEQVFDRSANGYALKPEKIAVLDAAHEVENAVLAVEKVIRGTGRRLRGKVRITSTDTLCQTVLPAALAKVEARYPELGLSLICSNAHLDFTRSAVDMTVRPAATAPEGLVSEPAATLGFACYGVAGGNDRWLMLDGPLGRAGPAQWLRERVRAEDMGPGADSFLVLREMVAAGLGRTFLPCILGDGFKGLQRIAGDWPLQEYTIWVACQPEMAGSPRMRAVRKILIEALGQDAAALQGRDSG